MPRSEGCGRNSCCLPHRWKQPSLDLTLETVPCVRHPNRLLNAGASTMPRGPVLPRHTSLHSARMSQTSTDRLREYLAQLSPRSQALLMREFERAVERGEETAVANFVLEQLRKIVRSADDEARPRTDNPARLLFRPLEPFLIESNVPVRPGQI